MKFLHVTIQTENFDREIEFYEKHVGLKIQTDMRPSGRNMIFLADSADSTEIEIIEKEGASESGNKDLSIGFKAEDLDAKYEELIKDGFEPTPFISPMPQVRFFFVTDPAGVNVQFM